jgi:hypothetical protein
MHLIVWFFGLRQEGFSHFFNQTYSYTRVILYCTLFSISNHHQQKIQLTTMLRRTTRDEADHGEGKEGGHSFLVDPITVATQRWNGHRLRALRKAGEKFLDLDHNSDKTDLGDLEEPLRRLSFTDKDLMEVVEDREQFEAYKSELRKRGAITNSLMKQNLHFYVQHQLEQRRASDSPTTILTPSSSTSSSDNRSRTFSFGST